MKSKKPTTTAAVKKAAGESESEDAMDEVFDAMEEAEEEVLDIESDSDGENLEIVTKEHSVFHDDEDDFKAQLESEAEAGADFDYEDGYNMNLA